MRLLLLRHAEAEPNTGYDFERALTSRGISQSVEVARSLESLELQRFDVYVSPARRTVQTWNIISKTLQLTNSMHKYDNLYNADVVIYEELLGATTSVNTAVVGHNPGISRFASEISGQHISFAPAEWALLEFNNATAQIVAESRFITRENS